MATTINKKYTITMTLSDGKTTSADFTIPVACPTAAEVKCATDWYDTETKEAKWHWRAQSQDEFGGSTITYYFASVTITFNHNIEDEALVSAKGYPFGATKTISGNKVTYSVPPSTTQQNTNTVHTATATLSYKMDNMSTVDDRLAYLYAHHA